jgi:sigma-B regulation protein RsbU (phosphoserine phosphatase)
LLRHKSEDIKELSTKGIVLGAIEDVDIELGSVELRPGDQVLFYTDGVIDAINPPGERYGLKHFEQSLLRHQQYSPSQVLSEILVEIDRYAESQPQADDLTLLLIRRNV